MAQSPDSAALVQLYRAIEDRLVPHLRLGLGERVVYYHLLRHSRLEGSRVVHISKRALARNIGCSSTTVHGHVRRLAHKGCIRIVERSLAGHTLEVLTPDEILHPELPAGERTGGCLPQPPNHPITRPVVSAVEPSPACSALSPFHAFTPFNDPLTKSSFSHDPSPILATRPGSTFAHRPERESRHSPLATDFFRSDRLRAAILRRENHACFYCLRPLPAGAALFDHVVPVSAGGDNSFRNIVAACFDCNLRKGAAPAAEFLRASFRLGLITQQQFTTVLARLHALQQGALKPAL